MPNSGPVSLRFLCRQSSLGPVVLPWHEQKCPGPLPLPGWHLVHAKLVDLCSPPGIRGCEKVALDHDLLGEWQLLHVDPKWFEGALWHEPQFRSLLCRKIHFAPGLWQLWHAPPLWPLGRPWHDAQFELAPGCENLQLLPTL